MQNYLFERIPSSFRLGVTETHRLPPEEEHPIFGKVRNWTYACSDSIEQYRKTEIDFCENDFQALGDQIRALLRAYSLDLENSRFIDKSQTFTLKIPLLRKFFPDSKFILISRNPFASCWRQVSLHKDNSPDYWFSSWNKKVSQMEALQYAAEHWKNSYQTAVDDLSKDAKTCFIKYEDFLATPENILQKILDHIELPFQENLLPDSNQKVPLGSVARTKWFPLKTDINSNYLSEMPIEAVDIIEKGVGQLAKDFSYLRPSVS